MLVSAPYTRRLAAVVIDLVCAAFPLWVTAPIVIVFLNSGASARLAALTILNANAVLAFVLYFVAQAWALARGQRTPGRRLLKLDVVGGDGQPLQFWRGVSRVSFGLIFVCACLLSRLYPLLLAPAVWTLVDGNGRSAFDCFLRVWVCSASTAEEVESGDSAVAVITPEAAPS
jgi:uncharacterized RDD family membrane protein YckC